MESAYLELVNEIKNLEGIEFVQDMSTTGLNVYRISGTQLYLQIIDVCKYRFCSTIQVVEDLSPSHSGTGLFLGRRRAHGRRRVVKSDEALARLPTESLRTFFLFHLDLLC